jgi:hypothetical protein
MAGTNVEYIPSRRLLAIKKKAAGKGTPGPGIKRNVLGYLKFI